MKKTKVIIPAMGLLLLSTAASVTGTVAWFSMNNSVTATAMQIKVKAEDGILISNSAKSSWTDSANATVTSATVLPTSAAAVASPTFVTANSSDADNAQAGQAVGNYSDLTLKWSATSEGVGYVDADSDSTFDDGEKAYVLLNQFYIKSSGETITQKASETLLYVNDVTATSSRAEGAFEAVDNSLRVLVVVNTDAFVYAPVINKDGGTTTLSYSWKNTTAVAAKNAETVFDQPCASVTSISNQDASAVSVKIYCYFEGEDANCKSTNISGITMENLNVTVNFGSVVKHA